MKHLFRLIVLSAVALSVTGCATLEKKMAEADERTAAKRATKKAVREGRIDVRESGDYYNSQFNTKQKAIKSEGE